MTRAQFEENVVTFADLLNFCWEQSLYTLEEIVSEDEMNEEIEGYIVEFNGSWTDLRDRLDSIDTGYEFYRRDGYIEFTGLDDGYDFDFYRNRVLEDADEREVWDPEEDEENGENHEERPEEDEEETLRRNSGYYFTDPMTGEVLVAGYALERIDSCELNGLFQ